MPNQNVNAPFYFDIDNFERAKSLANSIVENYRLELRAEEKDYGYFKTDPDYSNVFVSWDPFDKEYLCTKKSLENPAYGLWSSIHSRCYNPNSIGYYYYGARGITMDSRWEEDFTQFATDIIDTIGKKPERFYSIDRTDINGNYVLSNVKWSAPTKQNRHKTNTKITETSALTLSILYKYYKVTGVKLKAIYNDHLAEDESQKITKSWGSIYNACKSYCQLV